MFIGTAQVVRHAKEGINPQRLIPNLVRAKSGMALYLYILCMYKLNQPIRTCTLLNCSLGFFFLTFKLRKELNHINSINLNTRNVSVLWF